MTTPNPDEPEVLAHQVVVHSHRDAPCTRCGSVDIHTVHQCADYTRQRLLGAPGRGEVT